MKLEEHFVDNPLVKVYVHWINCTLCKFGEKIDSLTQSLPNGIILCKLIEQTTGCTLSPSLKLHSKEEKQKNVQLVLQFLESKGLEVNFKAEDVVNGDLKTCLDLLWLIILHFEIHRADRAAYQRTVSMGKRFLLEWSKKEIPDIAIETRGSFSESFQNGLVLTKIINKYSQGNGKEMNSECSAPERTEALNMAFSSAERKFGIPADMLSASDIINGNIDEYSLMIYVALLRRKIKELKLQDAQRDQDVPEKITDDDGRKSPSNSLNLPTVVSPASSPLSPKTLKSLVEQQAKSHAAIQALQEQLRAATYSPLTPKTTKRVSVTVTPDSELLDKPKTTPSEHNPTYIGSTLPKDLQFLLSPQNTSLDFLGVKEDTGEDMQNSDRRKRVTSVDRRFMEFIMDAVQRGCITDDFLDSELEIDSKDSRKSLEKSEKLGPGDFEFQKGDSANDEESMEPEKKTKSVVALKESEGDLKIEGDRSNEDHCDEDEDKENSSLLKRKANEDQNNSETTPKSAKRAQFVENGLEEPLFESDLLGSSPAKQDQNPNDTAVEQRCKKETLTPASLNNGTIQSKGQVTPGSSTADPSTDSSTAATKNAEAAGNTTTSEEDQFMAYLNSIEQSALMYKLQVEEAKIETLLTLKSKLEAAFEGTPLQEVPFKFREKLHDILHEVAEDQMSKYRDLTAESEAELDRSEQEYVTRLQVELDQVTFENREIKQQLEGLVTNQNEYSELREKIKELEEALFTMKSSYQYKSGESEFLAERITSLDKDILAMRLEYEQQLQNLRNENMDLQEICIELENENRTLVNNSESMRSGESSPVITSPRLSSPHGAANGYQIIRSKEYLSLKGEVENLKIRLEESENQVNSFAIASEADQAVIRNLEGKIHDMEGALAQAQECHSNTLSEIHESQMQLASTRALLSGYKEEVEAMRRENKLLKSSLAMSEDEVKSQNERLKKRGEPWKQNKKEIWREIRELENILKDVHKEKKNIEKKYVHFKTENDELNESLRELSKSLSPKCSPTISPQGTSACSPESQSENLSSKFTENIGLSKGSRQPIVTSPWEKSVVGNTAGKLSSDEDKDNNSKTRRRSFNVKDYKYLNSSLLEKSSGDISDELETLRIHVGSLEAEKAAILKELEVIRSPRTSS